MAHYIGILGNKNGTMCTVATSIKVGGITRFKYHLVGYDPNKNVKKCLNILPQVKIEMLLSIQSKDKAKVKKKVMNENICEELRGNLGR